MKIWVKKFIYKKAIFFFLLFSFSSCFAKIFKKTSLQSVMQYVDHNTLVLFDLDSTLIKKRKATEKDVALIVHHIQSLCKVMGLTYRMFKGSYKTHKQLRDIGINFAKSAYTNDYIPLSRGKFKGFDRGIIFCGLRNKGRILMRFFRRITPFCHPKRIVFVDDYYHALRQVEKRLASQTYNTIEFLGIHYCPGKKKRRSSFLTR